MENTKILAAGDPSITPYHTTKNRDVGIWLDTRRTRIGIIPVLLVLFQDIFCGESQRLSNKTSVISNYDLLDNFNTTTI